MQEKGKRDIFIYVVIDAVPDIEVFHCLDRQTTGQYVSYSGLKDYLLQVESTARSRETAKTARLPVEDTVRTAAEAEENREESEAKRERERQGATLVAATII